MWAECLRCLCVRCDSGSTDDNDDRAILNSVSVSRPVHVYECRSSWASRQERQTSVTTVDVRRANWRSDGVETSSSQWRHGNRTNHGRRARTIRRTTPGRLPSTGTRPVADQRKAELSRCDFRIWCRCVRWSRDCDELLIITWAEPG